MLDEVGLDLAHVLDLGGVLRGDDDGRDLDRLAFLVAHGDLGLAVGTQIGEGTVVTHGGQALGQPNIMPWSPAPIRSIGSVVAPVWVSKDSSTPWAISGDCSWMRLITPQVSQSKPNLARL